MRDWPIISTSPKTVDIFHLKYLLSVRAKRCVSFRRSDIVRERHSPKGTLTRDTNDTSQCLSQCRVPLGGPPEPKISRCQRTCGWTSRNQTCASSTFDFRVRHAPGSAFLRVPTDCSLGAPMIHGAFHTAHSTVISTIFRR